MWEQKEDGGERSARRVACGKRIRFWFAMFLAVCLVGGCASGKREDVVSGENVQNTEDKDFLEGKRLKVVTTIFPQYDFVRQIAGEEVELTMLLKPGEESHSYEPTPKDIIAIQNSDLFIYVGGENDAWVEDILDSLDMENMQTLKLMDCVETVEEEHVEGMKGHTHTDEAHEEELSEEIGQAERESDVSEEQDSEGHAHDEQHVHEVDEHVWTAPENAIQIVENILAALCKLDADRADIYQKNAAEYETQLYALDEEYRTVASEASRHTLLFGDRFPFRYFVDAYDLDYYAAFPGCASDTEPSAATMAFLIDKVKEEQIPIVLKMELSNENIAKAIAEATGTEVKVFYSCHNLTAEQFEKGETYLSMMEQNVETLKEALTDGADLVR